MTIEWGTHTPLCWLMQRAGYLPKPQDPEVAVKAEEATAAGGADGTTAGGAEDQP